MIKTAKGITDAEIEQAAVYFSGLKPRAVIKVMETATVPKSRVAGWFLAALPGGEAEPIFRAHGGRPHWAKRHNLRASELFELYPRARDFCTVRRQVDPEGKFANELLTGLFALEGG